MKTIERIREGIKECSSRHLNISAKWLSELLISIDTNKFENQRGDEEDYSRKSTSSQRSSDLLLLVESYMSLGEYARVVYTVEKSKDFTNVPKKQRCQRLYFLRSYAKYLLGEKRKEQELLEVTDPLEKSNAKNDQLQDLRLEMSELKNSIGLDAFNMYLLGIVFKASGMLDRARDVFVEALNTYPFIWSAWVDLALLCKNRDVLDNLKLRDHWMVDFFRTHALLELQQNEDAWQLCSSLKSRFGESSHLTTQMALVNYNMRRFDDAQELFEHLIEEDPHRLDAMDTYSNILYVKENRAELSSLAHRAVRDNKYRPETCCIIGNYYSLNGDHRKAVLYFKRALRLNRHFLSAWTLMGHEYVELKMTEAAIEAYRQVRIVMSQSHDRHHHTHTNKHRLSISIHMTIVRGTWCLSASYRFIAL